MSLYLIADIETLVDPSVWTPPADDPEAFAPPHAWRPLIVGCVVFARDDRSGEIKLQKVGSIGPRTTSTDPDERERDLLTQFHGFARDRHPTLVTWNGRRFDIPVLVLRALRYGISTQWFHGSEDTRKRYNEIGHFDLADGLSEHGACRALDLHGMARLIGLPGKEGQLGGNQVAEAYAAGRHDDIRNYCVADAVQTAFLWLRWLLTNERVSLDGYRGLAEALLAAWAAEPGGADLLAKVDRHILLLEPAAPAERAA